MPIVLLRDCCACSRLPDLLVRDDLVRLYLERNERPAVYRGEDLAGVLDTYRVYAFNNHHAKAQVWSDAPLQPYADRHCWQRYS